VVCVCVCVCVWYVCVWYVCVCVVCVCVCVCGCVCLCAFKNFVNYTDNLQIVKCAYINFTNRTQNFRLSSFVVLILCLASGTATKVLLTGSLVQVAEKLSRFMTDVRASRAFSMHGNSFTDPDAEFSRHYISTFHMSVRKALAMLTAFFAPYLTYLFKPNIVDGCTENYFRKKFRYTCK